MFLIFLVFCVVLFLCYLSPFCISGFSILDCPIGILQRLFKSFCVFPGKISFLYLLCCSVFLFSVLFLLFYLSPFCISRVSILDCPIGFLQRLFKSFLCISRNNFFPISVRLFKYKGTEKSAKYSVILNGKFQSVVI